jgi:dihydroxy-acid dehydratase
VIGHARRKRPKAAPSAWWKRAIIDIDIPDRTINLRVTDAELAARRAAMEAKGDAAWKPVNRERYVSQALQAYAALTTSADRGAVRDLSQLKKR